MTARVPRAAMATRFMGSSDGQCNASIGLSSLIKDHLAGGASRLAALLGAQIFPIFSRLAPCHPGAALRDLVLVQRGQTTSPRLTAAAGARRLPLVSPVLRSLRRSAASARRRS